jgi:hypothetical protein
MDVLTLAAIGAGLLLLNSSDRECGRCGHPPGSHSNLHFFYNDGRLFNIHFLVFHSLQFFYVSQRALIAPCPSLGGMQYER